MGKRLADARRSAGLSQRALAQAIGVSKALISMLECGRRVPRADVLMRLARALSVTADELMPDPAPRPAASGE